MPNDNNNGGNGEDGEPEEPREVPLVRPSNNSKKDSLALNESKAYADNKDLARLAATGHHNRREGLLNVAACLGQLAMLIIILIVLAAVIILAFHYLAPTNWHWITKEQLTKLETILYSSAAGSTITYFSRKLLGSQKD